MREGHPCPGRGCMTVIAIGVDRCNFCARGEARRLPDLGKRGSGPVRIAQALHDFEAELPTCPCGGRSEAEGHEASLLHQRHALAALGEGSGDWRRFMGR